MARQARPRQRGVTLRIIAGAYKGRRLATPRGETTRPTADQVRIALLDTLMPWLSEARVLDLFAGAGGVGLEALWRGARHLRRARRAGGAGVAHQREHPGRGARGAHRARRRAARAARAVARGR